ncbi:hypothetical protein JCM3775_002955 [Rhodotorula graminis]
MAPKSLEDNVKSLSLAGVASHTAPKGATGFFKWLWAHRRNKHKGDPAKELVYAEGVQIVRAFLAFAAKHGVGELQRFTASHVPTPKWVSKVTVPVAQANINRAAHLLRKAFAVDPRTVELVGGEQWWTLRGTPLTGEWIEMKKDKVKRGKIPAERVLLYLHGGAHFFSSLETHRYQIQRHARKLGARAFAPSQRLAPQYPFPCALHDSLAAYLFLIDPPRDGSVEHEPVLPEHIIISGDSAGGGLALSLLVLLRDLGLPMPAGATLISPWVDLSHSFPSVAGDGAGDYIPPNGFIYKPDLVWPPPPNPATRLEQVLVGEEELSAQGLDVVVRIDDQVQLYTHNLLLDHPFVSPVNQGSLGGLPPLYISCGGSELLHDEIIHIAHKAANPSSYPPAQRIFDQYPSQKAHYEQDYPPTKVQLQVFDGGCHVATTLSVTSLAKYMYRGAANAALFFLAGAKAESERRAVYAVRHVHRQAAKSSNPSTTASSTANSSSSSLRGATVSAVNPKAPVLPHMTSKDAERANAEALDEPGDSGSEADDASVAYTDSSSASSASGGERHGDGAGPGKAARPQRVQALGQLPPFSPRSEGAEPCASGGMVRQRVSLKGFVRPLEPAAELDGCTMPAEAIGRLHAGPVRKWLAQRREWDERYAKELAHFRALKEADWDKARATGYLAGQFKGERPPLGSVAGWADERLAKEAARSVDEVGQKTGATMALGMWSGISARPDEQAVGGEEELAKVKSRASAETKRGDPEANPAA